MPSLHHPLLAHQQRALATAAALVSRPRLAAGLALTLACGCGPRSDDGAADTSSTAPSDSETQAASTAVDHASTAHDDASDTGTTSPTTSGDTLLTEAGTTTGGQLTTGSDTGDTTTQPSDTTGELDDCFINTRTMEVDWDCCEQQNWMPAPQCTPWGPPAPPAAAGRLLAARQARRVLT